MKRFAIITVLAVFLATPVLAADKQDAKSSKKSAAPSIAERLKENPNDAKLIDAYMRETLPKVFALINSNPKAAMKQLDAMDKLFASLEPDQADAKQLLQRAKRTVPFYKQRIELALTSLDDLTKKLGDNPDDDKTLSLYFSKVTSEARSIARSDPKKAEKQVNAAKAFLAALKEKAQKDSTKVQIDGLLARSFARLDQSIAGGKKLLALIGTDSVSLANQTEAWVNGEALTDKDLKGKVVLLDFWAVWCGPCIATFPHLREWNEKYADKGLVIIGMTRYYNYNWDEAKGRAMRSREKVSPEDEQATIEKFCKQQKLQHRMAIQSSRELSSSYAVSGIPHVVVIDRKGKVRLIRVGSGPQNAKDIGELLEKLIGN